MEIVRIIKSPIFIICCLISIINLWLFLSHHLSCNITRTQLISHESSSLLSMLRRVASDDSTVIITMVDEEWAKSESLLDLFLESFRIGERTKHLLDHLIVVALDDQAFRYCLGSHPHCYLLKHTGRKDECLNPDGLINVWWKQALVKEILELGYSMMFTEADVMWFKNPMMHCSPQRPISVACGEENTGGFFYIKSNEFTIDVFKMLNLVRFLYPANQNQSLCDIVEGKGVVSRLSMKVNYLDDIHFGRFCRHPLNQTHITTLHASCCKNTKSKVHYLKRILQDRQNMNPQWRIPTKCR